VGGDIAIVGGDVIGLELRHVAGLAGGGVSVDQEDCCHSS
jgi:hypothetical protein